MPVHLQDTLNAAIELHRAGQLASAARLYQKVLSQDKDNAEALHLLGVLHHQQGDNQMAVEMIGRAVALQPNVAVFHTNLAEAYRCLGQFERAIGCCQVALRFSPNSPEALCNLGVALEGLGRHAEAVEKFERALELKPDLAVAHNDLGHALRELGRTDEALASFRRAIELDPQFAPALTNLGQLLLDRGEEELALQYAQQAAQLQPNVAAIHHNLGNVLRRLERCVEARAAYLEALRLQPNQALSQAHLGLVLQLEGKYEEALPWLRSATDVEPANAEFWEWLASLYDDLEEPSESIPCWERVLALGVERSGPHLALGWALQEEGDLAKAGEHYRTALEIQPDSAMAHLNLGSLHEEQGDMAAAEKEFREALEKKPQFALPHSRLATLLRGKLSDDDFGALDRRLQDESLGPGPRARLLFGLAHVLDGRGDFARAAECLRQANAIALELDRDRREYSPADHQQFVDTLLEQFDREFFARLAGQASDSRRPVFVFGLPRSGTTLTEQILAGHSQIHAAGELRLVRQTFEAMPGVLSRDLAPRFCPQYLDGFSLLRLAEQHLANLAAIDGGHTPRIVDKMPDNYMYAGLLAALFPRAVFIHCRRDLRDIAVSCWMTDFRSIRWANDPQHIAARFQQYRRVTDHWRAVLPVPIFEVDYESTVDDLEGTARRLVAACGLEWEPGCLEFYNNKRPVRTASVTQVRQPVYRRSLARWKHYEPALGELFAALPVSEVGPQG
jgi:tetratricopeptide (TPR) repeat protein